MYSLISFVYQNCLKEMVLNTSGKHYIQLCKEDKDLVLKSVNLLISVAFLHDPENIGSIDSNEMLTRLVMEVWI